MKLQIVRDEDGIKLGRYHNSWKFSQSAPQPCQDEYQIKKRNSKNIELKYQEGQSCESSVKFVFQFKDLFKKWWKNNIVKNSLHIKFKSRL